MAANMDVCWCAQEERTRARIQTQKAAREAALATKVRVHWGMVWTERGAVGLGVFCY
jgi:hypothetical protein